MIDDSPAPSFSKGARDEKSILFTVKDLVNAAAVRQSAAPPPLAPDAFGHDPAGLVDLHAMAHTTQSSLQPKQLDVANLRPSVVPMPFAHAHAWSDDAAAASPHLGSAGGGAGQKLVALAKGPRAPLLFAGLGIVGLLFVGLGAMLTAWALSDGGGELASAAPVPAVADDGVVEREVVQRTKVESPIEPVAATQTSARRSGRSSGGKASSGSSKSSKGSSPGSGKSTSKKSADPCNCHGQLACAMRCTK